MKASIFFILLGITLCTSLWAAVRIAWPYALQSSQACTTRARMASTLYAIALFWIVAAGPVLLLVVILNRPNK